VWLHTSAAAEAATHFPGGVEEHLAYLGWPLLITCLLTAVVGWRRVPVRCAAAGLICAMAFSLGGRLWIAGTWTEHSGPFRLLQALPVADASLATRFGLLAALFAATLLAFAVHWISGRTARPVPGALLAAALSLACLAPLVPVPLRLTQAPAVPAYFTGAARELPPHSVVVVLPYPVGVDPLAMRWQSAAHYRFRMPGGYFIGPGEDGHAYMGGETDPPTARLLNRVARTRKPVVLTRIQRSDAVADFAAWGADSVVLGPNPAEAALRTTVSDLLGRQPVRVGGVDIWPMSHQ
jgi:hypothetical protein